MSLLIARIGRDSAHVCVDTRAARDVARADASKVLPFPHLPALLCGNCSADVLRYVRGFVEVEQFGKGFDDVCDAFRDGLADRATAEVEKIAPAFVMPRQLIAWVGYSERTKSMRGVVAERHDHGQRFIVADFGYVLHPVVADPLLNSIAEILATAARQLAVDDGVVRGGRLVLAEIRQSSLTIKHFPAESECSHCQ
jgi:hypothetical protein